MCHPGKEILDMFLMVGSTDGEEAGRPELWGWGVAKRNSVLGAGLVLLVLDLILRLGRVIAF